MNIELYPIMIFKRLMYIVLFLLLANVLVIISKYYLDFGYVYGLVPLFDFNTENNIPTLYSSITLIFVSLLLSIIALTHKNSNASYLPWAGLAVIFLFLGIDEISSIHERLDGPTRNLLKTSGFFYYAWVIPYGLLLLVFVVSYLKFLISLPKNIMHLFVLSGSIFVAGAIGFEVLGGRRAESFGNNNVLYAFYYTCEETLEMLGVAIFIYTLSTYIVGQFNSLTIVITKDNKLV